MKKEMPYSAFAFVPAPAQQSAQAFNQLAPVSPRFYCRVRPCYLERQGIWAGNGQHFLHQVSLDVMGPYTLGFNPLSVKLLYLATG